MAEKIKNLFFVQEKIVNEFGSPFLLCGCVCDERGPKDDEILSDNISKRTSEHSLQFVALQRDVLPFHC